MRQGFLTPGGLSGLPKIFAFNSFCIHPQPLLQLFTKIRKLSQENCIFRNFFARIYYTAELVLP
jgi:hypothetical protein